MKILGRLNNDEHPKLIIEISHLNNKVATPIGVADSVMKNYELESFSRDVKKFIETKIISTTFDNLSKDYRFQYSEAVLKRFGLKIEPFKNNGKCMHINENCTHTCIMLDKYTIKCVQCGEIIQVPDGIGLEDDMNAYDILYLFSRYLNKIANHKQKAYIHNIRTICDFNDNVVAIIFGKFFKETSDIKIKLLLYKIALYAFENYKEVKIKCL